jgi:hypothetical protein
MRARGRTSRTQAAATKDAAKDTGRATKKTANEDRHAMKKTTKGAKKPAEGVDKVGDKAQLN